MTEKLEKSSILRKIALLVTLPALGLCAITNPGLSDYKTYEAKRFNQEYKDYLCDASHHHKFFYYNVTVDTYKSVCNEVISELTSNPERLLSFIEINTLRQNYFVFSQYATPYYKIENQVYEKVKQHRTYMVKTLSLYAPIDVGVSGSASPKFNNGIFGTFIDSRQGFNYY